MKHIENVDIIITSNAVFTGVEDSPKPASIAIKGNIIVAVGTQPEMQGLIGPHTKVYHFEDKLVMPGFNDLHLHIIPACIMEDNVNLLGARSEQEVVDKVSEFAKSRPDEEWVQGYMWYHTKWDDPKLPHRSSLDAVIPDRPVYLSHASGHTAWVNSKALEILGIDRNTPNPLHGEIMRDEFGEPTGILYESAASIATKHAMKLTDNRKRQVFETFLRNAAKFGVTSLTDIFKITDLEINEIELYEEFEKQEKLTTRIHFLIGLDGDMQRAQYYRDKYRSGKLLFSGLKEFLDGVVTTHTANLVEPYTDIPDTCGPPLPAEMREYVLAADKEGFRIRFHAVGDGAVRYALDLFEEAQLKNGVRDARHTIEHIEVVHPQDIPRFKELDVIASMQPEHMELINKSHYFSCIGDRDKYTFAIRSLLDAGAKVVLNTDYPVVSLNPLLEIYRAVTRVVGKGELFNESEAITLAETLKAYTSTAAYGVFREDELGTLEEGMLADLIVIDCDLFNVPTESIKDAKVELTVMDGKVVFEKQK
ncbi:amidohydrolase family protein [Paenibacillus sp. LMG 31458]|uniref:Amidohydrolase family protein n=1 Tax=Paenibacillus phytorum TaxID=2654977 RepID=A0ABX1Y2Y3_9BACL|nr:amidohydrolase [Paenibacillus phytorum]NOU74461.1 amidohydrolase family protein [Paenibacillus phytorum]